ncbi:hypothetical protein [Deinococcus humi]|uniref:Uncharacterized protein n=1 Tax=Deinococcus humi TaxID=662880 RepID=A0A7W8JUH1_9DEIO|nr:hypothetical protein [Deinococcus humi]MBB5363462.1 hypothetical protein [Deinococcus humi]GGO26376.1 hypothetical protein GCM10008949_17110 [Deinococcus humi]
MNRPALRSTLALLTLALGPSALATTPPAQSALTPPNNMSDLLAPLVKGPAQSLGDEYAASVRPPLQKASSGDVALNDAQTRFTRWRAEVERAGLNGNFTAQINEGWSLIARGVESSVNRGYQRCLGADGSALTGMLYWIRWVEKNPRLAPYFAGSIKSMKKKTENCGTYELEFTSYIRRDDGMADRVRATAPVKLYSATPRPRPAQIVPTQQLEHVEGSYQTCPYSVLGYETHPLGIVDVQLETRVQDDLLAPLDGTGAVDPVLMIIEPHLEVQMEVRCPTVDPDEVWHSQWDFDELHEDETITFYELIPDVEVKGLAITDFKLDAQGNLRKEYRRTVTTKDGVAFHEETTFLLRHRAVR